MMAGWLVWGVDLALLVLVAECLWLARMNHRRAGGWAGLAAFLPMALAGFSLILALRVALVQGPAWLAAGLLCLGGIAHLADLKARIGSSGR